MTSVRFVPLLPIVAQVAGIDIYKCKLLEDDLKRYILKKDELKRYIKKKRYIYKKRKGKILFSPFNSHLCSKLNI